MFSKLYKIVVFTGSVYFLAAGVAAQHTPPVFKTEELEEARIFPFNYDRIDVRYDLFLNLADPAVVKKYMPVFVQYRLSFNGETWEAVLRQALERIDADVAQQVQMMPEDEGVYVGTGGKALQQRFLREILPVLSNTALLEKHLQRLDRSRLAE